MPPIDALRSEYHVWLVNPDMVTTPAQLDACQALLSTDELRRQSRFRFARDRHRFLVSHGLVRQVLSTYWPIAPQHWFFALGDHGKPEIDNPGVPALRFNLTHTAGLSACMVTLDDDCGIDAEYVREREHAKGVARRMFSPAECAELEARTGAAYLQYFFESWTLREAYVKARGIGIAYPTHKLLFSRQGNKEIAVEFHADIDDNSRDWYFELFRPTARHVMAAAIHARNRNRKTIVLKHFEPFSSRHEI
jgi:4'-phosphopantetheinyl transferase